MSYVIFGHPIFYLLNLTSILWRCVKLIFPILWMKKLRHKVAQQLAHDQTPGVVDRIPEAVPFISGCGLLLLCAWIYHMGPEIPLSGLLW